MSEYDPEPQLDLIYLQRVRAVYEENGARDVLYEFDDGSHVAETGGVAGEAPIYVFYLARIAVNGPTSGGDPNAIYSFGVYTANGARYSDNVFPDGTHLHEFEPSDGDLYTIYELADGTFTDNTEDIDGF